MMINKNKVLYLQRQTINFIIMQDSKIKKVMSEKDVKCILKLLVRCENDPHNFTSYHFAIAQICIRNLPLD